MNNGNEEIDFLEDTTNNLKQELGTKKKALNDSESKLIEIEDKAKHFKQALEKAMIESEIK